MDVEKVRELKAEGLGASAIAKELGDIGTLLFGGLIIIWVLYFLFRKNIDAKSEE